MASRVLSAAGWWQPWGWPGGLLLAHPQLGAGAVCAEPRALLWVRDLAFFPCWTSWGCSWPLLPTCKGLSSSSAAIPGLGGGTDGSVLSILLWEPHTGATSSLSPGQGVHIHAESCKMPERGAVGAGGPMASSCSAQTLLGHPEAAPGAVPSSPCWQQCAWCLRGLRCPGFAGDCASPCAEPRSARGMLLDHPRGVLGSR